eukprot:14173302-Ditylum_brightwellii.AAC.1
MEGQKRILKIWKDYMIQHQSMELIAGLQAGFFVPRRAHKKQWHTGAVKYHPDKNSSKDAAEKLWQCSEV